MKTQREKSVRRAQRNRIRLRKFANGRPRLSVYRAARPRCTACILVAASSLEEAAQKEHGKGCDTKAAEIVGKLIAERAVKEGVKDVVFDRGGYIFHGRVKALAEAAREGGLNF